MEIRVKNASKLGKVPEEAYSNHKEFSQWDTSYSSRREHDTILHVSTFFMDLMRVLYFGILAVF
jgi:hypothetical protein